MSRVSRRLVPVFCPSRRLEMQWCRLLRFSRIAVEWVRLVLTRERGERLLELMSICNNGTGFIIQNDDHKLIFLIA